MSQRYSNMDWDDPEIMDWAERDEFLREDDVRQCYPFMCAPRRFCNPRVSCMPLCFPRSMCAPRRFCNPRVSCMPRCFPRMCYPR